MTQETIVKADDLRQIEDWFVKTHGSDQKSPDEVQILILHKLYQMEERLKTVEQQTRTHWVN